MGGTDEGRGNRFTRVDSLAKSATMQRITKLGSGCRTDQAVIRGAARGPQSRRRSIAGGLVAAVIGDGGRSREEQERRRAMPAQGGSQDRRRDAGGDGLILDDVLQVIVDNLWRYHRLLPPASLSKRKFYWDMLVIALVMFNCFVVPVELCFRTFQDLIENTEGGRAFQGFTYGVDALFAIDIVINFRTTYFNEDGDLQVNWREISNSYVSRPPYWFWMDLLGTIPWDVFNPLFQGGGGGATTAAKMLKLPRLLRLSRLMKNLDQLRVGNVVRIVRLLIYFLLCAHGLACIWWVNGEAFYNTEADFGTSWIFRGTEEIVGCSRLVLDAPYANTYYERAMQAHDLHLGVHPGFMNNTEWEIEVQRIMRINWVAAWCDPDVYSPNSELLPSPTNLFNGDFPQQYISAFYWSLTMVMKTAYVGPDTAYEKLIASIMVVFGSLVYIIVLASIVSMLTAYGKNTSLHRDHRETVSLFCRSRRLYGKLRRRWFAHIQEDWNIFRGVNTKIVLKKFPYHLRANTLYAIHSQVAHMAPMFKQVPEEIVKIILHSAKHECQLPKTTMIIEGQHCNQLYLLVNGVVQASHSKAVLNVRNSVADRRTRCGAGDATAAPTSGVKFDSHLPAMAGNCDGQRVTAACHRDLTPMAKAARELGSNTPHGAGASSSSHEDAVAIIRAERQEAAARKGTGGSATSSKSKSGSGRSPKRSRGRSGRGLFSGGRKDAKVAYSANASAKWKSRLRESAIIEREGSMLGFADPFVASCMSVYTATAWTKVEVLAFDRQELAQALYRCKDQHTLHICAAIEKEYNNLLTRLKAKEHHNTSVAERSESKSKADDYRKKMMSWAGNFNNPEHLDFLNEKCTELEKKIENACADAAAVRQLFESYIAPISQTIFNSLGKDHAHGRMLSPRGLHVHMRRGGYGGAAAARRGMHHLETPGVLGLSALGTVVENDRASLSEENEAARENFAEAVVNQGRYSHFAHQLAHDRVKQSGELSDRRNSSEKTAKAAKDLLERNRKGRPDGRLADNDVDEQQNTAAIGTMLM